MNCGISDKKSPSVCTRRGAASTFLAYRAGDFPFAIAAPQPSLGGMTSVAHLVHLSHPELGAWLGAVDAAGRWLVLLPASETEAEVARLVRRAGRELRPADAAGEHAAQAVLDRWLATGEAPPVDPPGTAFQQRVWAVLSAIPRGETRTYGEIGAEVGCRSARAVGGAVGANPVGLFIPCHRVVAAGGALGGFAWGPALKCRLLRAEGVAIRA